MPPNAALVTTLVYIHSIGPIVCNGHSSQPLYLFTGQFSKSQSFVFSRLIGVIEKFPSQPGSRYIRFRRKQWFLQKNRVGLTRGLETFKPN